MLLSRGRSNDTTSYFYVISVLMHPLNFLLNSSNKFNSVSVVNWLIIIYIYKTTHLYFSDIASGLIYKNNADVNVAFKISRCSQQRKITSKGTQSIIRRIAKACLRPKSVLKTHNWIGRRYTARCVPAIEYRHRSIIPRHFATVS